MENVKGLYGDKVHFAEHMYEAADGADALLIATEWSVFRNPDFEKLTGLLKQKVIFDGRNLYELGKLQELGFYYESIGRETVSHN
jgi:UDPglucose 6-dehydrogenase